jgi:hypothetical protein
LYKYRTFNDVGWRMLTGGEVFFASPASLNDPHDTAGVPLYNLGTKRQMYLKNIENLAFIKPDLPRDARRRMAWDLARESYRNRNDRDREAAYRGEVMERTRRMVGILSLSAVRDSAPMWAHYSENHTGFCIGFDTLKLKAFFDVAFGRGIPLFLEPVRYCDGYPALNPYTMSDEQLMLSKLLSKSRVWEYEQEYRVLCADHPDFQLRFPLATMRSITLGTRCDEENRNRVISILQAEKRIVTLERVIPAMDQYGLQFEHVRVGN